MLASKRVKQLYKGNQPLIDPKNNRLVVTALREIAAGKVNFEINKKQPAN
jgi:DNA-directed RNA polymerase subunit omega